MTDNLFATFSRSGERSKSSSVSEVAVPTAVVEEPAPAAPAVEAPVQTVPATPNEPLVNGDIKPGKTPVVSINSFNAERDGATSPRSALVSQSFLMKINPIIIFLFIQHNYTE